MLFAMKEPEDLYFVKDGMLIGEDKFLKYFREGFEDNKFEVTSISGLKDFALDEILIDNAEKFDIYAKCYVRTREDGDDYILWQFYPTATLTRMSRDVASNGDPSTYARVFESPSRATIQVEDLPECLRGV